MLICGVARSATRKVQVQERARCAQSVRVQSAFVHDGGVGAVVCAMVVRLCASVVQ